MGRLEILKVFIIHGNDLIRCNHLGGLDGQCLSGGMTVGR